MGFYLNKKIYTYFLARKLKKHMEKRDRPKRAASTNASTLMKFCMEDDYHTEYKKLKLSGYSRKSKKKPEYQNKTILEEHLHLPTQSINTKNKTLRPIVAVKPMIKIS